MDQGAGYFPGLENINFSWTCPKPLGAQVSLSNSSRMLGENNASLPGARNQLAPFGHGWVTPRNSTCDSWRWSRGMEGGPFGATLGGAGWPKQPFIGNQGRAFPCVDGDFICVTTG